MKLVVFMTILISHLYSQSISVSADNWDLLGTSKSIDLDTSLSGNCMVYVWDRDHWQVYDSSGAKDVKTINKNAGFFAISKDSCKITLGETSGDEPSGAIKRFESITKNSQTVLKDTTTKLEWINSAPGCLPLSGGMEAVDVISTGAKHCGDMNFGGNLDWRVATTSEVKTFLEEVDKENITPFYKNPGCPRLIGFDGNSVSTVNTHNNPPIGKVNPWTKLNAGIRCVRSSN